MEMPFIPRFTISARAIQLISEIAAALERYRIMMEGPDGLRLRKLNRIRTIRGTTAIEGNTLTEAQVTDVIGGKRVAGSRREITEVKNAHRAYETIHALDPRSPKDLLKAHGIMTEGLVDNPGRWRKCNVRVANARGKTMLMAPPWDHVPFLMKDVFAWLKRSKDIPLVQSCVFHYAIETIHPFPDGNGRMGRLWQTAILGKWNPLFYAAPVESMVFSHQRQYYRALHAAQTAEDAGPFIDFMLDVILRTVKAKGVPAGGRQSREKNGAAGREKSREKILALLRSNPKLTYANLADALGLTVKAIEKNVRQLRDAQLLRRVGPDKGGHWEVVGRGI